MSTWRGPSLNSLLGSNYTNALYSIPLHSLDDLIKAGITLAENVVVVNKEFSNSAEEDTLSDCNTIVSVQTMFKYDDDDWIQVTKDLCVHFEHFFSFPTDSFPVSKRSLNWVSRPTCGSCNSELTISTRCTCRAWKRQKKSADRTSPICFDCRSLPAASSRLACWTRCSIRRLSRITSSRLSVFYLASIKLLAPAFWHRYA